MTIVESTTRPVVTAGVDTYAESHVAAAVDANGGVLGVETFDASTGGYRAWSSGSRASGSWTRSGWSGPGPIGLAWPGICWAEGQRGRG